MGSLKQRGGIWWIRYYRNGRRHEESTRDQPNGGASKQEAIDLLKIREGDVAKGLPITAKIGQLRFEDAAADVLTDYRTNGKKTLADVTRRIDKHLSPFFGGRRMATITTSDVRAYIDRRQKDGASNGSINWELCIIKRAFTLAVQAGRLLHKPFVPILKAGAARAGFFEREAFDAMRRHLPKPLQAVATFAYCTGWRVPSEVLTLEWRQVDRKAGTVRLDAGMTKNGEPRVFPYKGLLELEAVIDDQWNARKALIDDARKQAADPKAQPVVITPRVFHRNGKPVRSWRKAFLAACTAAGCPGRIPHDFRRTAVRNLVIAGVPEKTAMMLTGHLTRSVFDRYCIVNEANLRDAVTKLAASNAMGTISGTNGQNSAGSRNSENGVSGRERVG